jgi:hypothetical protein
MSEIKDGWMLPEAIDFVQAKPTGELSIDMQDLYAVVSLACGLATGRCQFYKNATKKEILQASATYMALLSGVDAELFSLERSHFRQIATDDSAYQEFAYKIVTAIRNRINLHTTEGIPESFKITKQFKDWMSEAGTPIPEVVFIDNWIHPLAATKHTTEFEGLNNLPTPRANLWLYVSIVCATACNRLPKNLGSMRVEDAEARLIEGGVIDEQNSELILSFAQHNDDAYLQLLVDYQAKLEQGIKDLFGVREL